ncbi:MAG: hypothetical protein LBJ21_04815 [Acidobacteriota bacterium]|jgi:hypothetical protein|nr:hypothetical protein [Acidobacteriota bacterium]
MEETTIPDYPRGITFEQVWAALMEDRKRNKETWEQMKKTFEEAEKRSKEAEKRSKELDKRMGDLYNRFGEIAEHLVAPGIAKRFNELGYHFGSIAPGGYRIVGEDGKIKTEIDILLENDETVIAVEVKTKPAVKDVEHHIRRLEILREYRNRRHDDRKIMGAIAGAIFGKESKDATLEAGLYVIEQSGDTMKIDIPHDFVPGEW